MELPLTANGNRYTYYCVPEYFTKWSLVITTPDEKTEDCKASSSGGGAHVWST